MRALVDDAVKEFDLNPKPVRLFLSILIFGNSVFSGSPVNKNR